MWGIIVSDLTKKELEKKAEELGIPIEKKRKNEKEKSLQPAIVRDPFNNYYEKNNQIHFHFFSC